MTEAKLDKDEKERLDAEGLIFVSIAVKPDSFIVSPSNEIYDYVKDWFEKNPREKEYL